jgi:hypothetical protein
VFVLSAVIIRDSDSGEVDRVWKDFKARALGSPNVIVHEPDVRKADEPFYSHRTYKLAEMRRTIAALPFTVVTVVVHRDDPYLWKEVQAKMCPEVETDNSILGLKIMPWRNKYRDLWKS